MNGFVQQMEVKLMPIANKSGSQHRMTAIRKGLITAMPLAIVGSLLTIFQNIPAEACTKLTKPCQAILDIPSHYTMGLLAPYATFGIASSLAKSYKLGSLTCGILVSMAFLVTAAPPARVFEDVDSIITAGRYINLANLGSAPLFDVIVTALLSAEIYRFFIEEDIVIRMPDDVPPEVSNSFIALVPGTVILLLFWVIRYVIGFDLNGFLSTLLMPPRGILAGNSLFGDLLTVFLICFFWVSRVHGPAIMGPVIHPFWDILVAENLEAFTNSTNVHQLPNIFTEQFLQQFIWIGGAGITLSLVVLVMFSKSTYLKSLGRLSFLPGLFDINEPVIFGAPIVVNPILGIPFIVAPLITTTLPYFLTVANVVPMMAARLAFATPAPTTAWMSTNQSFSATVLVIVNFLITVAIYYPFFEAYEKQQLDKEAEELATEQTAKN